MNADELTLYELAGADSRLRFSPHCWKVRMALAHKGVEARLIPWRFSESEAIAFSNQRLVPILVHDGQVITDSWHIAQHIEGSYPDRTALFRSEEHTSELQFLMRISYAVFCLKKKNLITPHF